MMDKKFFVSFLLSVFIHIFILFLSQEVLSVSHIGLDVIKGDVSIEVSLVDSLPMIKVPEQSRVKEQETPIPIKRESPKKKEKVKKIPVQLPEPKNEQKSTAVTKLPNQRKSKKITNIPQLPKVDRGAITKEISSLLLNHPPVYPRLARIKGWEGVVVVIAEVDTFGKVHTCDIFASSGYPILDQSALSAVRQWRFRNVKTRTNVKIPIKFILTDRD